MVPSKNILPDIFEAIRYFSPGHYLLELKINPNFRPELPKPQFELTRSNDGKIHGFPHSYIASQIKTPPRNQDEMWWQMGAQMMPGYFRGENRDYGETIPSGFRDLKNPKIPFDVQKIIDKIKIEDFRLIAETFPSTIASLDDGLKINWLALAQHYGLRTPFIDLTSEIFIAAFFATHHFNCKTREYEIVPRRRGPKGIGCLKSARIIPFLVGMVDYVEGLDDYGTEIVGLQQFRRPCMQLASGWNAESKEPLYWDKILFYQSEIMNKKIHNLFYKNDKNILFPDELIADVADKVDESESVTKKAVNIVAENIGISTETILNMLNDVGYKVTDTPVFILSNSQREELTADIVNSGIYGDVSLGTRKVYYPPPM